MIADAEYRAWREDMTNLTRRQLLVELDYNLPQTERPATGHGRHDENDSLPEVVSLRLAASNNTLREVTYLRPQNRPTAEWEIWIGGTLAATTALGSYAFNVEPGAETVVAVATVTPGGRYSRPFIATLPAEAVPEGGVSVDGALGSWADVGDGPGDPLSPGPGVATVRLAPRGWLSDQNDPYDDGIIGSPILDQSLDNFLAVGEIDAINQAPETEWSRYDFRGQECRWLYGDVRWPIADYRRIATSLIGSCRPTRGRQCRFDLLDGGRRFRRTFLAADETRTSSTAAAFTWLMGELDLPPVTFVDIPIELRARTVTLEMTTSTTAEEVLRRLATGMNTRIRFSQGGDVEIIRAGQTGSPLVTLGIDDIAAAGFEQSATMPAYARVTVEWTGGAPITRRVANASGGRLNEEIAYKTALDDIDVVRDLSAELRFYHRIRRPTWKMRIFDADGELQVGDAVSVDHPELAAEGVAWRMRRAPLSRFSTLEVLF